MAKQKNLPEFYFSYIVLLLRISGIEIQKQNESFLYKVCSTSAILFVFLYMAVESYELKCHSDFNTICLLIWYIVIQIMVMVKVLVISRNRAEIRYIMTTLHESPFKPNKFRGGEFEQQCIIKTLKTVRFQTVLYGAFSLSSWVSGLISSIKSRIFETPGNWKLPFAPISLVNTTYSPNFEIAYLCQGFTGYLFTIWIFVCDCTVISIIALIRAQLDILKYSIRNYKHESMERKANGKTEPLGGYDLRKLISYHICILEIADRIEYVCSYLIVVVFVAGIILLCITMYAASVVPLQSIELFRYFVYGATVVAQQFLYCSWGNKVTAANEELALNIYESYNPDHSDSRAKVLKLMLLRAQKPLYFTAGKFVPLSLETFKAIMKGSFSYFTVLRQMNAK